MERSDASHVRCDIHGDGQCHGYRWFVEGGGVHEDRGRAKHWFQLGRQERRVRARCRVSSESINAVPKRSSFSPNNDPLSISLLTLPAVMANQTPAGWTYRQILETVAYPPRDAPHLWHVKVSQLAADLGMPSGASGQDIIMFVIHVATMKNEADQVAPLVRALRGAARLLEGRDVVPKELQPLVAELYPGVARMLGFLDCAGKAGLNTAAALQVDHCDDVSCPVVLIQFVHANAHVPRIRSHLRPASSDRHQIFRLSRTRPRKKKRTKTGP